MEGLIPWCGFLGAWLLVVGMAGIALGNVALSAYRTRSVLATDPA